MPKEKSTRPDSLSASVQQIASTDESSHLASASRWALSLRWYLVLLVAGTLLPIVLFAVAVVYQLSNQEQAASERRILLATRNLASTVERELSSTTRTLQALAAAEPLEQGDLKTFHTKAKRVLQTQPTWLTVILLDPNGQQLVNTIQPFGRRLPSVVEKASLQRVVSTQRAAVGNLTPSKLKPNLSGFPVRIPVIRSGRLQYVLTAIINREAIARVVNDQATVDGEWTRTVVDGGGVVVARTRNPELFVGKRGTPSFLKQIGEATEGIYQDTTLEGVKVCIAFRRVSDSPWTVAVTVPLDVIKEPGRRAMKLAIGSGLTLLFISGVGAVLLSRQISRSITSAAFAAEALANGQYPRLSPLSIKEVVLLGRSLEFAANLLMDRERERTENLRQAEAARSEAEAANRIKDEFLAVLSHELRTPLNPIIGWSRLLRSGRLDEAKTALALETVERNAKLQAQLIDDLLDVSRIIQGKLNLNIERVDLKSIIESAIETVRLTAEAKSIQIETRFDFIVDKTFGDAARLQQVIWNLLTNAVKFTDEGGRVEVRLEQVGSERVTEWEKDGMNGKHLYHPPPHSSPAYALITVTDTGKGIHPDFLPHVFKYFRQEDGKTTRKFGGLGLGLAIAQHLVELHGGMIQVDSLGEGKGSTFTVQLPLSRDASRVDKREEPKHSSVSPGFSLLKALRVLLVDDEMDSRDFIAFTLEQNHAIVTSVSSAHEALQVLERTQFDLLISDIGMPEMDGYMLMQKIRSRSAQNGGQVPAIALTAYAGEYNQQQALQAGFQRHVVKPIDSETLVKEIIDLISTCQKAHLDI